MDEQFFWLTYPSDTESCHELGLYTFDNIRSGQSPITDVEPLVRWAHIHLHSVASNSATRWYFPPQFGVEKSLRVKADRAFQTIARVNLGILVSSAGMMVDGNIIALPQLRTERDSHSLRSLLPYQIDESLRLTEQLFILEERKRERFLEIYRYLSEIRYSLDHVKFIGELALWSFIEHYFSDNQSSNTDETKSLNNLLEAAVESQQERRAFRKKIGNIGKSLGKPYNEKKLRNILAHGSYITLQEGWTDDNWQAFYTAHEQLFTIVANAIRLEVSGETCDQQ